MFYVPSKKLWPHWLCLRPPCAQQVLRRLWIFYQTHGWYHKDPSTAIKEGNSRKALRRWVVMASTLFPAHHEAIPRKQTTHPTEPLGRMLSPTREKIWYSRREPTHPQELLWTDRKYWALCTPKIGQGGVYDPLKPSTQEIPTTLRPSQSSGHRYYTALMTQRGLSTWLQ